VSVRRHAASDRLLEAEPAALRLHLAKNKTMPRWLVKVGEEGLWSLVKADLSKEDRVGLLAALAGTRAFEVSLRGVALDACTVRVCASASDEEPSAAEAAIALELKGAKTLGALTTGMVGNNLFIHVQQPTALMAAGAGVGGEHATLRNTQAEASDRGRLPQHASYPRVRRPTRSHLRVRRGCLLSAS
jgi:hypothetical protein